MRDVFIAHVEEDADIALGIVLGIEEAGYTTWCYEIDSIPGPSYLIQTGQAVEQAKAIVVIISPHSVGSRQVTREIVRAHETSKEFIPLLRGITHIEFQNRQPEWREALGAAASIRIPQEGVAAILPRIITGLEALGIRPTTSVEGARIAQIRKTLEDLQGGSTVERIAVAPLPARKPEPKPVATEIPSAETAAEARKRPRKSRLALVASGSAVLLTVGIVGAIMLFGQLQHPAPTAPVISPTSSATPVPYPSSSPPPTSMPTPTLLLSFSDDFSSAASGWSIKSPELPKYECGYQISKERSEYYMLVKKSNDGMNLNNSTIGEYSDFTVQVDGRSASGSYGLNFRSSSDTTSRYFFLVSAAGKYAGKYTLAKRVKVEQDITLVNWTESAYIKRGTNQINRLMVECRGSEIKTYVNGQFLASVSDNSFQKGYVGLMARADEQGNMYAYFDNFSVFSYVLPASFSRPIVFVSARDGNLEIYRMDADGTGQTRLTNNPAYDNMSAWSPDGTRIAFVSERDGDREIYVMNANGSEQRRLTNNPATDMWPAWSPDGTRIAFISFRDGDPEVYVMNADGTSQIRLSNNPATDSMPTWSPDSNRISFVSHRDGNAEIYAMNADGTSQIRLTSNTTEDNLPAWSPDGTRIAFVSERDGNSEIYKMNTDGTGQTRLTKNSPFDNLQPLWLPDGNRIAFVSNRDGNWEIYAMNADGTKQTRLTNNTVEDWLRGKWVYPTVATQKATNVTAKSARLNGDLTDLGSIGRVTIYFECGLTAKYTRMSRVVSTGIAGPFTYDLSDLTPNTTYHFRAVAIGDGHTYGKDVIFNTAASP